LIGDRLLQVDKPLGPLGWLLAILATTAVTTAAAVVPDSPGARAGLAAAIALILAAICLRSAGQGILVTIGWLTVIGLTRRLVTTFQADPRDDPLLLAGVGAVGALLVIAWRRGALFHVPTAPWGKLRLSPLAICVLAWSAVALIEVVNPAQGSLRTGIGGLLFWLVPVLWFWVGRAVIDRRRVGHALLLTSALATIAAVYGLLQAQVGFPFWDEDWIANRGYDALNVNGPDTLRSFGFSPSAGEYALLLSAGVVLLLLQIPRCWRHLRGAKRAVLLLVAAAAAATCSIALALSTVRTALVLTIVALALCFAAARRWGFYRAALVGLVALVALVGLANLVPTDNLATQGLGVRVFKTVRGLAHPFADNETLKPHISLTRRGLESAWHRPLGYGTGAATLSGDRDPDSPYGSENDLANAAIAFGVAGAVLVLGTLVLGLRSGWRLLRTEHGWVEIGAFAVLIVSLRFWWNGAYYGAAPLVWLLLGWIDGLDSEVEPDREPAPTDDVVTPAGAMA
jgi:hypothetical protein